MLGFAALSPVYRTTCADFATASDESGHRAHRNCCFKSVWLLPVDASTLRFQLGSEITPHSDSISIGRDYWLNIVPERFESGSEFMCVTPACVSPRINMFRPDAVTCLSEGLLNKSQIDAIHFAFRMTA